MFDICCFFHSDCYDVFHIICCFGVVLLGIVLLSFLITLIISIVECCIHTSDCNALSLDNQLDLRSLELRVEQLERKVSKNTSVKHCGKPTE